MRYHIYLLVIISLFSPLCAQSENLRLTSLEWAPYVSRKLPSQGMTAAIVQTAAEAAGLKLEISYFPWSRTVQQGLTAPQYAGYFPAFYLKERESNCYFSKPLGNSIIGFAHVKPFDWAVLADLKKYRLGLVHEYANGEEFDRWVKQGWLNVDSAPSDQSNLRKLLAGRVDVIVIDQYVFKQLLQTARIELPGLPATIQFHARALTKFSMHVCFQKNARGLALRERFDQALQKLDIKKLEALYFQSLAVQESSP